MPQWFFVASASFYTVCFLVFVFAMARDFLSSQPHHSRFETRFLGLAWTPIVLGVGVLALALWYTVAGAQFPLWLAYVIDIMKVFIPS